MLLLTCLCLCRCACCQNRIGYRGAPADALPRAQQQGWTGLTALGESSYSGLCPLCSPHAEAVS